MVKAKIGQRRVKDEGNVLVWFGQLRDKRKII